MVVYIKPQNKQHCLKPVRGISYIQNVKYESWLNTIFSKIILFCTYIHQLEHISYVINKMITFYINIPMDWWLNIFLPKKQFSFTYFPDDSKNNFCCVLELERYIIARYFHGRFKIVFSIIKCILDAKNVL